MVNFKGHPSWINTTPRPLPKASHFNKKSLVKLETTNIEVVHVASFKVEKAYLISFLHTKSFVFSRVVNGVVIFP
jgi:hypothetical protein